MRYVLEIIYPALKSDNLKTYIIYTLKKVIFRWPMAHGDDPSVQFLPQFLGRPQHGRLGRKLHVCHPEMPHGHSICHLHRGYQRLNGWCIYSTYMYTFKIQPNASQHIQHHLNLSNSPPTQIIFSPNMVFQFFTKPQVLLFWFIPNTTSPVKTCPVSSHLAVNFVRCRALPPPHLLKPPPRRSGNIFHHGRGSLLHGFQGERSRRRPRA